MNGMQTRSSDENSVRPSVRLSHAWIVDCDKTVEKSVQIYTPYKRAFSLFSENKNGWWGDPFYLKFWVNWPLLKRNSRFSTDIRLYLHSRNT